MIYAFISGAIALGCFVVSLFFYFFWDKTKDRLFGIFSMSFGILALERVLPFVLFSEQNVFQYVIRLIAFVLVLMAIIDKTWSRNS